MTKLDINQLFSELSNIDFGDLPDLKQFLSYKKLANTKVGEPHHNLFTSPNLYTGRNKKISGVWVQKIGTQEKTLENIQETGKIAEHDHSSTNEHEVLIFDKDPGYANLPTDPLLHKKVGELHVIFIPVGTRHGSNTQPSQGSWVSIKVQAD